MLTPPNGGISSGTAGSPHTENLESITRTVMAAVTRLWDQEVARRIAGGPPLKVAGAVVTLLLEDEAGRLLVGLGTDYEGAPAGDPRPLINIVGRHLQHLAETPGPEAPAPAVGSPS